MAHINGRLSERRLSFERLEGRSLLAGLTFHAELPLDAAANGDRAGRRIATTDQFLAVGIDQRDSGRSEESGVVDLFRRDDNQTPSDLTDDIWRFAQRIEPPSPQSFGAFGWSLALAESRLVVGAPTMSNGGRVFTYRHDGDQWKLEQELTSADQSNLDSFGVAVDIDGDTLVVGSHRKKMNDLATAGAAYVFAHNGSRWTQTAKLLPADPSSGKEFGTAVAVDQNHIVVGAPRDDNGSPFGFWRGSAYVFQRRTPQSDWQQQTKLAAYDGQSFDQFGYAVDIWDGMLVVGSPYNTNAADNDGSVYSYRNFRDRWVYSQKVVAPAESTAGKFGWDVALNGERLVIGAPAQDGTTVDSGAVYAYQRNDQWWTLQQQINNPVVRSDTAGDYFGSSVGASWQWIGVGAMLDDVGTSDTGAAFVYHDDDPAPRGRVVGRYVAYNNSAYDGFDPSVNPDDDSASAPDKWALLPEQTATSHNYISYVDGITMIIIDIRNAPQPETISAADFSFAVGNNDNPSTWTAAPAPAEVIVRPGAGNGWRRSCCTTMELATNIGRMA